MNNRVYKSSRRKRKRIDGSTYNRGEWLYYYGRRSKKKKGLLSRPIKRVMSIERETRDELCVRSVYVYTLAQIGTRAAVM